MRKSKYLAIAALLVLTLLTGTGCEDSNEAKLVIGGQQSKASDELATDDATSDESSDDNDTNSSLDNVFIIQKLDTEEEAITFYSVSTGRQYKYKYNLSTKFLDKYGDSTSWSNFMSGQAVEIGDRSSDGVISTIQKSDAVWEYNDITNFEIDLSSKILTIGQTKYDLRNIIGVYSDDEYATLTGISEGDTLRVVGVDKDILTVAVTTGHGYILLKDTDKFNGSMVQIGSKIFSMVSAGDLIEVPEGTYDLTVANDGYGGTKSVEVVRNETTEVSLAELEGEGPKYCSIQFQVSLTGATIYLDGSPVNAYDTMMVKYGKHSLKIVADGYDTWSKTLYVNSPSATIALDLSETDSSTSTDTSTSTTSDTTTSTTTDSSTSSSTSTSDSTDAETDYLTTLSEMLSTLMDTD